MSNEVRSQIPICMLCAVNFRLCVFVHSYIHVNLVCLLLNILFGILFVVLHY